MWSRFLARGWFFGCKAGTEVTGKSPVSDYNVTSGSINMDTKLSLAIRPLSLRKYGKPEREFLRSSILDLRAVSLTLASLSTVNLHSKP